MNPKLLKVCKKKHFLLSNPPIQPGNEGGSSQTQQLLFQAKQRLELTCGAKIGTGGNTRQYLQGFFRGFPENKPLGAESLIQNETLGLIQDESGSDWVDSYTKYASATKYGVLIMAISLENFRLWANSKACLKEVSKIPDGRLFAYIEHTTDDANGRQGYIVSVMAQKIISSPTVDNGKGYVVWANGDCYHGYLIGGQRSCYRGIQTCANGDVYIGEWKYDMIHGQGKYTWANGEVYDGQWKDGNRHGRGTIKYADNAMYEGEWKDEKRHGRGKSTFSNGDIYVGEWKDNRINGQGKYTWANSEVYDGQWKDGKRNGQGTNKYSNNDVYKGEWKDDKRNSQGKFTNSKGDVYDGKWENDMPITGDVYEDEWKDGKYYDDKQPQASQLQSTIKFPATAEVGVQGTHDTEQEGLELISQLKTDSSLYDVFISARFLNDQTEEQARELYQELLNLNVSVFMVHAKAGDDFGSETMRCLYHMKTLIAFCSSKYGAKTNNPYSTYYELKYANDNNKHILPIRRCEEWPPAPLDYDGESEGKIQNHFVFKPSMLHLDWFDREWDAALCAAEIKEIIDEKHHPSS